MNSVEQMSEKDKEILASIRERYQNALELEEDAGAILEKIVEPGDKKRFREQVKAAATAEFPVTEGLKEEDKKALLAKVAKRLSGEFAVPATVDKAKIPDTSIVEESSESFSQKTTEETPRMGADAQQALKSEARKLALTDADRVYRGNTWPAFFANFIKNNHAQTREFGQVWERKVAVAKAAYIAGENEEVVENILKGKDKELPN